MNIRSITANELDLFLLMSDAAPADELADMRQWISGMWADDVSRPEWCFVVEDQGQVIGRVGYQRFGLDAMAFDLTLPWAGRDQTAGTMLLQQSGRAMTAQGMDQVVVQLTSAMDFLAERQSVLERAGFQVHQAKTAFEWLEPHPRVPVPDRLRFRSLNEVGQEVFVAAIASSYQNTLDQADLTELQTKSPASLAQELYDLIANDPFVFQPDWWQLAYTQAGILVGLLQPVLFRKKQASDPWQGTIGYIGVIPEQRGHGYIDDLLAQTTAVLQEIGVWRIFTDTDSRNFPMIRAFERAGYDLFSQVWRYGAPAF
jgi:RimJ/RimL family protein N-acetyltransferase